MLMETSKRTPYIGVWAYSPDRWISSMMDCPMLVNGIVNIQPEYNINNPVIVPLREQHRPNFTLMDSNAPPQQSPIIMKWLQEAGVSQMECPALSPDLNLIKKTSGIKYEK
ncbi:hypothetical protein XENOCAPTIV_013315 [Xenoophorus captivus]|uniref:Uncharacterized protein n=1 Tax=Xenoophorus captivus TaxID=1517983 RepID=A0ABV0QRL2_9TELE